jgi:phosphoribosylanthranilate isomerase
MQNLIQIAGVTSPEEARILAEENITHLGFPLRLTFHKEDISESEAKKIISSLQNKVQSVLITYLEKADEILEFTKFLNVKTIQLHGEIELSELERLKKTRKLEIIKSLIVKENNLDKLIEKVGNYEGFIDYFITDTYDPGTGACGATGKVHDWEISKKLVKISKKPIILAGGLTPENVKNAIIRVKPAGVDVHTGVEDENGIKNPVLVRSFITNAKAGFASI